MYTIIDMLPHSRNEVAEKCIKYSLAPYHQLKCKHQQHLGAVISGYPMWNVMCVTADDVRGIDAAMYANTVCVCVRCINVSELSSLHRLHRYVLL